MANNVALLVVVAVAVLLAVTPATEAVTCSPVELTPCAPVIMYNQAPSSACCAKLQEQKPCLCGYAKNPSLKSYIDSPGAKRMASTCKVNVSC
uniref:Bifunctional inhibitor/plant lipid transfer protein/seed storage helical domain-containing protein n=1 Tax=Chenopodium quinoa TaxID=63459 RepID=A0A803M496_CHEQI